MDYQSRIVRVKFLKEELIRSYGQYMHRSIETARRGEAAGIWQIVDEEEQSEKELVASSHGDGYLTKAGFAKRRGSGALTKKDVLGE